MNKFNNALFQIMILMISSGSILIAVGAGEIPSFIGGVLMLVVALLAIHMRDRQEEFS